MDEKRLEATGYFKDMNEELPPVDRIIAGAADRAGTEKRRRLKRFEVISMLSVAACLLLVLAVTVGPLSGVLADFAPGLGGAQDKAAASMDSGGGSFEEESGAADADAAQYQGAALSGNQEISAKKVETADKDYSNLYDAVSENAGNYRVSLMDDVTSVEYQMPMPSTAIKEAPAAPDTGSAAPATDSAPSDNAASDNGAPVPAAEAVPDAGAFGGAGDATASAEDASAAPGFSDTNIQTAGVQEADIVKTDGVYIYAAGGDYIYILRAGDGHPEILSKIKRADDDDYSFTEMYITEGRLILLRERAGQTLRPQGKVRTDADYGCLLYPGESYKTDTSAVIYDVTDKKAPKILDALTQSGWYSSSRMIGDKLYLISAYSDFIYDEIKKDDPETYVPLFVQGNEQSHAVPEDITMLPAAEQSSYTVVSAIDTLSAKYTDHESVYGGTPLVYASADNLYLAASASYNDVRTEGDYTIATYGEKTLLTRIKIEDGQIDAEAQAEIAGRIDDQFSMDEYGGVLRVVTTEEVWSDAWKTAKERYYEEESAESSETERYYSDTDGGAATDAEEYDSYAEEDAELQKLNALNEANTYKSNTLYTLDMNLKELGRIGDLAPDEQVYSARFMGGVGYFVTFRQTDPLFSVDLSDPKAPKILGELKIPGFSEYLQSWSADLLFGFGKDADTKTGEVKSLKLKMFNVSDPSDVKEDDTLVLKDLLYSEASGNHKAILANASKGLVAFPTDEGMYVICSYSPEEGFKRIVDIDLSPKIRDDVWYNSIRGLFIGDVFYVVSDYGVLTYDMNKGFKNIDRVVY